MKTKSSQKEQYLSLNESLNDVRVSPNQQSTAVVAEETKVGFSVQSRDFDPQAIVPDYSKRAIAALSNSFGDDIRILLIGSSNLRLICHFIQQGNVNQIHKADYTKSPLIIMLAYERLVSFMESNDYRLVGEISFDDNGIPIPVKRTTWKINDVDYTFISNGYLFFEHTSGNKKQNLVFLTNDYALGKNNVLSLRCYGNNKQRINALLNKFDKHLCQNNCLRGAKLKNVNMIAATFSSMPQNGNFDWNNYYFELPIKKMFDLEVFGFLNNLERYKKRNITKRGILLYGPPGCVRKGTKIKVRLKHKEGNHTFIDE